MRPEDLSERLRRTRRRLEAAEEELRRARADAFPADRVVWIFGTGRSGTTWLASMLGEFGTMWNEPLVGALFGEFYYERAAHKRGRKGILGEPHRELWISQIRRVVLEGAAARYPDLAGYLTIKEPHGSTGAPLLSEAVPESKLICLVRDPRDVVASSLDAQREGSWTSKNKTWQQFGRPSTLADTDPDGAVADAAKVYARDIEKAREAYENHGGPKSLVKYEDLRSDAAQTLKRLYSDLGIPAKEAEIVRVAERHRWENVPAEKKGGGKFYRKGTPGGWKEDLTPEQARMIEEITAPMLEEFYPGTY